MWQNFLFQTTNTLKEDLLDSFSEDYANNKKFFFAILENENKNIPYFPKWIQKKSMLNLTTTYLDSLF